MPSQKKRGKKNILTRAKKMLKKIKPKRSYRKKQKKHSIKRKGRGILGFTEDTTENSCIYPVKKCNDEYRNCRSYYYFDTINKIYRPCRNPKKEDDPCRPTASLQSFKCINSKEEKYREDMAMLDNTLELEEQQENLLFEIKKRIGKIYHINITQTNIENIPMYVSDFPTKKLEKKYPEINFQKFIEKYSDEIMEQVNKKIDIEIEMNSKTIDNDYNILSLYSILKKAEQYKSFEDKFNLMFAYNNSSTRDDFLYEFGNIEVIEKMKKRELKEQERIMKLAKKINEEANLKREQLKKKEKEEKEQEELYKMYMELDHIRIKSKEGTIKSEPKSIDKKSIDKKSIDKKSIDKNDSIKSDNSSVQSLHVYRPSIR